MPERKPLDLPEPKDNGYTQTVRSLRELIDIVTGRSFQSEMVQEDAGLAEIVPFPYLGLVGQEEMKLALLLAVVNPLVNGVVLVGPRGTGKTTTARSLADLLPEIQRSNCFYGCLPEDVGTGGIDSICPDCARKYAEGIPLTRIDRVRLIELPLNATLDDVIGGLDERAQIHDRMRLKRGILAQADLNLLYVDEVNLLEDGVVNALLDASATGSYTLRRAQVAATYRSRFTLIGSMNPEEGSLRPQIMDRFGLRVIVRGLEDPEERLEAYRRSRAYRLNPRGTVAQFLEQTQLARDEIQAARNLLPGVEISSDVARLGVSMIQHMHIDSLRAELTLFEAARAYAAADARTRVTPDDLRVVAPMTLRLRHSPFMLEYFKEKDQEDSELHKILDNLDEPAV
jgi:magnesium chelatase subunit I